MRTNLKPGISELFISNPELSSIGTQQEYSDYLNTIFPNSIVKDILYHGTSFAEKIEKFKAQNNRIYFSNSETAAQYAILSARIETTSFALDFWNPDSLTSIILT